MTNKKDVGAYEEYLNKFLPQMTKITISVTIQKDATREQILKKLIEEAYRYSLDKKDYELAYI